MLTRLVTMMGGSLPAAEVNGPLISSVSVSVSQFGACGFKEPYLIESVEHTISWIYVNPDSVKSGASAYSAKLYRDNVLIKSATLSSDTSPSLVDDQLTGWVVDGEVSPWNHTYKYRVDIVRNSDGAIASSGSASIATDYGRCH